MHLVMTLCRLLNRIWGLVALKKASSVASAILEQRLCLTLTCIQRIRIGRMQDWLERLFMPLDECKVMHACVMATRTA